MKTLWRKRGVGSAVAVTHELSEAAIDSWAYLRGSVHKALGIAPSEDALTALAHRFSLAPDIVAATVDGATLITEAMCPASAWLFNRNMDAMLRHACTVRPTRVEEQRQNLNKFGFQTGVSRINGSEFLEDARRAGYDIIRTSSQLPNYVIRDLNGGTISVLQNFTDLTSHIATKASTNKLVTAEMLNLAGLPTPKTYKVFSANEASEIFKREALQSVVIKPQGTDRGLGVHTSLTTEAELSTAFDNAKQFGGVIMQEHVKGDDFRILVVDGAVMGVTRRTPFFVVGDGTLSIDELMAEKIKWRGSHPFYKHYNKIATRTSDTQLLLQKQGLTYDAIPTKGQKVVLRSNANVSSGGEHEEVTQQCHPDIKELARECVALFGLDLAGVDYISSDITQSWRSTAGKICEVNPTPALSVDGVPSKIFSRLNTSEQQINHRKTGGDLICVRNCSCRSIQDLKLKYDRHRVLNLTECSEAQYFFQSYLVTRNTNYLLIVTSETLNKYGLINSNVRTLLFCGTCKSSNGSKPEINITSPYELTKGFF